jgi:hypothetical protein
MGVKVKCLVSVTGSGVLCVGIWELRAIFFKIRFLLLLCWPVLPSACQRDHD